MAVRMRADSFAMTARSSAAVLQARTARISSRSRIVMVAAGDGGRKGVEERTRPWLSGPPVCLECEYGG